MREEQTHGGDCLGHIILGAQPILGSQRSLDRAQRGPETQTGRSLKSWTWDFRFPWANNISYYLLSTHNVQAPGQKLPIECEDPCLRADEAQAWGDFR